MNEFRWDLLGAFMLGAGAMGAFQYIIWRQAGQPPANQ